MILFFRNRTGKPRFSQGELSLILNVYGAGVQRGSWRDYAIDSLPDMAVFSILRASGEQPAYSIMKISGRSLLKPHKYAVYSGAKALSEGPTLTEVLGVFETAT